MTSSTRKSESIEIGDLVRPSRTYAQSRAIWSNGNIPHDFIAWNAAFVDSEMRRAGAHSNGQVHIPWDKVGLVVALRNRTGPEDTLVATVQFPEGIVLCFVSRLERVDG